MKSRQVDLSHMWGNPITLLYLALMCTTCSYAQGRGNGSVTPPLQLPLSGRQISGVVVQQSASAPSGATTRVQIQIQGSNAGSVPTTEAIPETFELSLSEAVQRGLRANLGIVASELSLQQARAQIDQARSAFLPNVAINASENAAKLNLAAEGFSASAFGAGGGIQFPTTVGPFHYYDLHGALQQSLLDVTAIHNLRGQGKAAQAALLQSLQTREEVVLAVAGVYLQLMADSALVDRQKAEVALGKATYEQAEAQADAGNKAPIEANRSLVEYQTEQQRLRAQMGEVRKRQIQLARLIGLPLSTRIVPRAQLNILTAEVPSLEDALKRAASQRRDLKAGEAQVQSAEEARKAASAQRLPSASLNATYGIQGTNPDHGNGVFQAAVSLNIPVYQGGRIEADIAQADAVVRQRRADLADLRGSVESDVRTAYVDMQVANDAVTLADSNRKLATETLKQSQDRFAVGVADSVEVVSSQQALAAADNDYVNSLFSQHVARIALAHSMGEAEQTLPELFERKAQ